MSYEVDILAVGDESQSGDAIAMRFGDFVNNPGNQTIVVIDGGFKESGTKLVDFVRDIYGADRIDLVVSTHPDNDHISGLHVVLEEIEVGTLWMHRPWHRSERVKKLSEERGLSAILPASKLKKSLESAYDLEKLATQKGVTIEDPFQQRTAFDGVLHVLGPSEKYYNELLADFDKGGTYSVGEKVKRWISEVWHQDELVEPEAGAVSARNNSSVVLLALFGTDHFMFCGDAGVEALHLAADYADSQQYDIATRVRYHQIPHHGSKRNLGPSVLDRIIGPIGEHEAHAIDKHAFVSSAVKGAPRHPSQRVLNAMIRRGVQTSPPTCGVDQCFRSPDVPMRPGYYPLQKLTFQSTYEEED